MRTSRLLLVGTVVLTLLGAWTTAASAQDEFDPMAPAYFTFAEPVSEPSDAEEDEYSDEFTPEVRGYLEVGHVESTDSRATGRLTTLTNMNMLEVEGGGVVTAASRRRLVNDEGAWSGVVQGLHVVAENGGATMMAILTGEGGYEGLTLIMVEYADDDAQTRRGVIIPSDQLAPMPFPEDLPAE